MSADGYEIASADGRADWDAEADVVIVGCGVAGLCAAIEARSAGADVLVLERASGGGGITLSAAGHVYLGGGTRVQKAVGVEDTVEDMEAYLAYEASRRHAAGASPGRQQGKQAALAALAVPTEMVALASTALKTCDELKEAVSKYLLSDLLAAAHLLHGAAFAAAANARLNLRSVGEARVAETYRTQITSALAHADLHLSSISSAINKKLSLPS